MGRNLYITAPEPASGKSVVALGLMHTLAGRAERAGFFRPVAPDDDPQIELIRQRFALPTDAAEMRGLSDDEARALTAAGRHEELEQKVFDAFKAIEGRF